MSEAASTNTSGGRVPPFTLEAIDLDNHVDGTLLRMCDSLVRVRSATAELEAAIVRTAPLTIEGRRMKELTL